jgi:hypothetical protein
VLWSTHDPLLRWFTAGGGTFVLVTLIYCVTSYFPERQRLTTVRFVTLVQAESPGVDVEYSDGRCRIRAGSSPPEDLEVPEDGEVEVAVLPMRPDGQPERRRSGRRRSDAS